MQCSAWRPTSSASVCVRPLSSSTRWNSFGPSPSRTPVHSDVYGFMRSAVEERGSSCRKTSRSRHSGSSFSIPITVTSTSGSVVHMRPLPSDSTTATVPVSAIPKFAPEIATGTERNFSRRCRRAASAIPFASHPRSCPWAIVRSNRRADLGAVLVDRRDEDVRRALARELDDQLRQVGLDRRDALGLERRVELDLVGGDRLDLDHLARAVALGDPGHDRVRLGAVARPVHDAAGARHRRLELLELLGQRRQRALLDRRPAVAQRLPVGQLADRRRRLARIVGVALPRLRRSCASCSVSRAAAGKPFIPAPPGSRRGAPRARRCAARRAPPMCIRHELSADVQTSARVSSTLRSLSESIAIEVSAFLTANVPPKPQHSCASASSTRSMPCTARSSRSGASPTCSSRSEWQVGW